MPRLVQAPSQAYMIDRLSLLSNKARNLQDVAPMPLEFKMRVLIVSLCPPIGTICYLIDQQIS